MRIAALSDIHSNLPALEAVLEDIERQHCDRVIVAGDFINCGPWPRETVELLRASGALIVRGNHEEYVLDCFSGNISLEPPDRAMFAPSRWTAGQLTLDELRWLEDLPERVDLPGPDGSEIMVVHGSPRRNNEGLYPSRDEQELAEIFQGEIKAGRLVISGHTHRPLIRPFQEMLVTNCGSTGMPLDGDTRACYLLAEWDGQWRAEHRRVKYNREATLAAVARNASYDESGPFMRLIKQDIEDGISCGIPRFGRQYRSLGVYPRPPHDFAHLDEAITRYLNRQPLV